MPRFFLPSSCISDGFVSISGNDALHIARSLRMKRGEVITVCDAAQMTEFECELDSISPENIRARVLSSQKCVAEPPFKVRLYQAMPKGDKLDTIIQKAVETGVFEVIPFESERCIVKAEPAKFEKQTERRQRIALEAAKQCGRGIIPTVRQPISFDRALKEMAEGDIAFMCYEGGGTQALGELISSDGADIRFMIGPEGGFSEKEVEKAVQAGLGLAGLGKRILRTETASSFVLSCITYERELKNDPSAAE